MAYIKIFKRDDRRMDNLTVAVNFRINGEPYYDWEDLGTFSTFVYAVLDGRHGTHKQNETWVGEILKTTQRGNSGPFVLQIDKEDTRKITNLTVTASFTIDGAKYVDFQDIGNFESNVILNLTGWGGGWNEEHKRFEGDFLHFAPPIIGCYVGVRPAYPADLFHIPFGGTAQLYMYLGFAVTQPDGQVAVKWDTDRLNPESIKKLRTVNGKFKFLASVGGDAHWLDPQIADDAWVQNQFNSLSGIIDSYGLDGIDFNYEWEEKDPSEKFARLVGAVVGRLKNEKHAIVTVSPFAGTWLGRHETLYQNQRDNIDLVNYQMYADKPIDVDGIVRTYDDLAQTVDYPKLGIGICTATRDTPPDLGKAGEPRGIQNVSDMKTIASKLWDKGVRCAWTFCLEDSVRRSSPYEVEKALEETFKQRVS